MYGIPAYIILRQLEIDLRALAAEHKGLVVVAHEPAEALEMLGNAPQQWRTILSVDDETAPVQPGHTGASDTEFTVIVQAGLGLSAEPGAQIHLERTNAGASVLELAEAVRCWIRGIRYQHPDVDCSTGFNWQRSTWVSVKEEGKPARFARQHVFVLQHRISNPAAIAPKTITYPTA